MNKKRVILWFRNDLRLHDNEAIQEAMSSADEIIPIYVFDERVFFGKSRYGFKKTGVFRAKFILESVINLRKNLRSLGSDLIIRLGIPEEEIYQIARDIKSQWVFCNRERTKEEVHVQDNLERNLWSIGQEVRYSRGKMLYYTSDLPFPVTHTPDTFTQFRKEVEKIVPVRDPFSTPSEMPNLTLEIERGEMPTIDQLGYNIHEVEKAQNLILKGGEDEALKRLKEYIWDTEGVAHYKETRNGFMGKDFSSKFSPYLAQGCLSPKTVYHELIRYEAERIKNDSTYHLYFELLWRDFFRLMGKKHGNAIFLKGGTKNAIREDLKDDLDLFRIWAEGRTGMPLIDASMKALNETGYISNRARQNVASFLINDLKINWQIGAEYFECLLIDYDPCSNWGNWNYLAGVGSDPRERRYFNVVNQSKKYDPQGNYIKFWLPQLKDIPSEMVHHPSLLSEEELDRYNCILQKDYPQFCLGKLVS